MDRVSVNGAAPDGMTCKELVEVVTDYMEGTMAAHDRERFDDHLAECPHCVNYLDRMRETIEALGELREESIPADARDQLIAAFRGWRDAR